MIRWLVIVLCSALTAGVAMGRPRVMWAHAGTVATSGSWAATATAARQLDKQPLIMAGC